MTTLIRFAGIHEPCAHSTWHQPPYVRATSTSVSWIQANITGNAPATRCCHSAVYNPTLNKMIVFGGAGGFANGNGTRSAF